MSEQRATVVILPRRTFRSIVALFIVAAVLSATSILFTVGYVNYQNRHQAAVAAKAARPLCGALLRLAQIKGSHGDSGATYGLNLEKAFEHLYATTSCPALMKEN